MEILFELIFEFVLQLFGELLIEILTFSRKKRRSSIKPMAEPRKPLHPVVAGILWLAAGAAMGGASLLLFPHYFLQSHTLRLAYLVLVPLLLGAVMALIGRKRLANGQEIVPLDKFGNAALFAFGMALVRYLYTTTSAN